MQDNNVDWLRTALESLSTQQLEEMLRDDLQRDKPNSQNIRLVLQILQEREKDDPVQPGPEAEAAWERYLERIGEPVSEGPAGSRWVLRIASAAAVLILLLALLPQEASARNFFERLISWTDSVFALVKPEDAGNMAGEYVFRTENPGLQQVYDTVTELGVTQPVVPMWLPEGFELTECKTMDTPMKRSVIAVFSDGNCEARFEISIYSDNINSKYYKNEENATHVEYAGVVHNIVRNDEKWIAIWVRDNCESSVVVDCQEETLLRILMSIYVLEDE